ncbi:MAG: PEP-CTERM sorting domain-containing protein [Cyanobacteria bacterium P01_D01_bin.44]
MAFSIHEGISFPPFTTQELIDTGRVGDTYLPPNGQPVTALDKTGQFARVTAVPEPSSLSGLFAIGSGLLATGLKHRQGAQPVEAPNV